MRTIQEGDTLENNNTDHEKVPFMEQELKIYHH